MEGSILSTYMFGILVLLLIIVIIVMYYLWNETKKNKNTITMLESDMEAIRGRLEKASKHIEQLESFEMPGGGVEQMGMGMGKGGPSKMAQQQHILEQLMGGLGMRDFMQTGEDDDEYDDEEDESGSEEDDEEMSGDESGSSGSEEESEYETVNEDDEEEECDACGTHDDEEMKEHVMEEHVETESVEHEELPNEPTYEEIPVVISPEMNDHINNLLGELNIDGGNNKKFPVKTPSECEVGVVMKGGDSKDYVVALNKRGGKYWKPLK